MILVVGPGGASLLGMVSGVGMLRITGVGANAVEYLLRGCGCDPEKERAVDAEREHGREPGREWGREPDRYFGEAVARGEPAGVWLGRGMEGLGLDARAGDLARDGEVKAVFGQLRYPSSTERDPVYIGSKPREYPSNDERLERLLKAEGELTISPERYRELEIAASSSGRKANAYYDFTYSAPKSVSVYWAALHAAGLHEQADAVRAAHDAAVDLALGYAEEHIAYSRAGYHGRTLDGSSVGEFVAGQGVAAIRFSHSSNRENEPQLHAHVAVLNRTSWVDEWGDVRIGALDSRGFRAFKAAFATAYGRAAEEFIGQASGAVFAWRPDGAAREIVGVDPELIAAASGRTAKVNDRVTELVDTYTQRYGREPSAAVRKELVQRAVFDTRKAKDELAGPAAVQAWGQAHRGACEQVIDQVDAAALAAAGHAQDASRGQQQPGRGRDVRGRGQERGHAGLERGQDPAVEREGRVAAAVSAAIADLHAGQASWTVGDLAMAIDARLGAVDELGVTAAERPRVLEELARAAVTPGSGHDVVQLTGHEPVAVPEGLCRASDGRPWFRPHADQRYAAAAQLDLEARVVARARETTVPAVPGDTGREAVAARLARLGLAEDQRAAVVGVLGSGRGADVLVGPAGAGKSRTVAALAHEWAAATGGRVFGIATSQRATANLACNGMTSLNVTRFLTAVTPDPATGAVRDSLAAGDLVIVDEAGMSAAAELDAITTAVRDAGGKVLFTGDAAQLPAVGAGGLFAQLAEALDPGQCHELVEVHRFADAWEAEASLRLRQGEYEAVSAYLDRGRLHAGTAEEMETAAVRGYVADTVAGHSALLIVSTNEQATQVSDAARAQLIDLGQVQQGRVATLRGDVDVSVGDVVQARRNDFRIRVDPARGPDGQVLGPAAPVTNRELYRVLGADPDGGLRVRDQHGAIAHLPRAYVREHLALGYATTVYGALGLTVERGHVVIDRDAGREDTYVGLSRGREANYGYVVAERDPDPHHPEPVAELLRERMVGVLDNLTAEASATALRELGDTEAASLAAVAARIDLETSRACTEHTRNVLDQVLDAASRGRLGRETERPARDRLARAVRGAELAGHDPAVLLSDAVGQGELATADSIGDVLRWRVRQAAATRAPERDPATGPSWPAVVELHRDDPAHPERGAYLAELAGLGDQRQAALAAHITDTAPSWALDGYGPVPEAESEPAARAAWQQRITPEAVYRDLAGIEPDQHSLGEAPSEERVLARALWRAAIDARGAALDARGVEPASGERDWRVAGDAELYAAREAWARAQDHAPAWVAEQLAATHQLAGEYEADAALDRARAQALGPNDPQGRHLEQEAERGERFAAYHRGRAAELEAAHQARAEWWASQAPTRQADAAAADELARRHLPPHQTDPERDVHPDAPDLEYDTGPDATQRADIAGRTIDEQAPEYQPAPIPEPARQTESIGEREPDAESGRWVWDEFTERLRAEHGARLDPDRTLDDEALAHARATEITTQRETAHRAADRQAGAVAEPAPRAARQTQLDQVTARAERAERDRAAQPARDANAAEAGRQHRDTTRAAEVEHTRRHQPEPELGRDREPEPGRWSGHDLDRTLEQTRRTAAELDRGVRERNRADDLDRGMSRRAERGRDYRGLERPGEDLDREHHRRMPPPHRERERDRGGPELGR